MTKKPTFFEITAPYHKDEHMVYKMSVNQKVDARVMLKMIKGIAVRRAEAEQVLVAFSAYTDRTWDLDNAEVILMPTFKEVYDSYKLSLDDLTGPSKFYQTAITQMLKGEPVLHAYAVKVLAALSEHVGKHYTLEIVDVVLIGPEAEV